MFIVKSKTWVTQKIEVEGSTVCAHDWVYGTHYQEHPGESCLVYHNGSHCSWTDDWRPRICKLCGRLEKQEEIWVEEYVECPPVPKTEFEIEQEKWRKKSEVGDRRGK